MTIRQLEMFLAVFRYGNLSDSAKALNLSQSAISMGLKELQGELNEKLFDRVGKKLIPNSSAQRFHAKAAEITALWGEAATLFSKDQIVGSLKIGASQTIATYVLPPLLYAFKNRYERVEIDMAVGNTEYILRKLQEGALDVCYVEGEVPAGKFVSESLSEDELIVITSREEFANKSFFIDELFTYRWILREKGSGTREHFEKALEGSFKELNIFMELRSNEAIKTVLRQSDSFSCLSRYAVQEELRHKTLFEVPIKQFQFTRPFLQVRIPSRRETQLLKAFGDFVKQQAQQNSLNPIPKPIP